MKWLALIVCSILILPLSAYLRRHPVHSPKVWMLLGLLPFMIEYFHLYMAIDSTAGWGGYVKGAEVSGVDLIAIGLYFTTTGVKQPLPFRFAMAFYFIVVVLSAFEAWQPKESLFYPWQLARMFVVYATVARGVCSDPRVSPALMTGMGTAIIVEAGVVIWQRFGLGMVQAGGTIGHQNGLGLMSHLVILPFFALLLAGRRGAFPIVVVLAGTIVIVSTASRATIGLEGLGFVAIFVLSTARKWSSWKGLILACGVLVTAFVVPAAISSLQERFAGQSLGDDGGSDWRKDYIKAATMMLADHPLGIGANHFSVIGNTENYYNRAGVPRISDALSGNVHNFYLLSAVEIGYQGFIALLLVLARPLIVALRCGWRNVGDYRGDLLLGLGVALSIVYLHSWVEWVLVIYSYQYLLAIAIGLVAGNAQQLGYWSARRLSAARPSSIH